VADTLKDQGNRAFSAGDYPTALDHFTDAIEWLILAPDSELASAIAKAGVEPRNLHLLYSNRSATYAALRDWPKALEDADRVVELKPDWAKAHFRRGAALEGLSLFAEAAQAYGEGLKLDPTDAALRRCNDEVTALLREMKLTEAQLAAKTNPDADRFELMVRWLRDGGAKFPRLYLQYYSEDYRGVHCLSRIPSDEIILFVPHHMVMTSQVALESPIGKAMLDAQLELRSKHSYLACCQSTAKHAH
jgi:stress-induced-phosphoprotein 1